MHRKATLALVSLLGGLVTACSSTVAGSPQSPSCAHGTDAAAVAPTTHCYARAVGRGDADTACSVLTAKAQRAVASSALKAGTVRCADAMHQAYAQLKRRGATTLQEDRLVRDHQSRVAARVGGQRDHRCTLWQSFRSGERHARRAGRFMEAGRRLRYVALTAYLARRFLAMRRSRLHIATTRARR